MLHKITRHILLVIILNYSNFTNWTNMSQTSLSLTYLLPVLQCEFILYIIRIASWKNYMFPLSAITQEYFLSFNNIKTIYIVVY